MKYGKKVACGSSERTIYLFNWNGFGATSDRFALRAESIDFMVPVTENLLCTASTDGTIRAVNILPNRVVGTVGQHAGEPMEELALSHCSQIPTFLMNIFLDKAKFLSVLSMSKNGCYPFHSSFFSFCFSF